MKVSFKNGSITVVIYAAKFVENVDSKLMMDFDIPVIDAGIQTPMKTVLYAAQLSRAFTITGIIDKDSSNQSRSYADDSLDDLRDMIKDTQGCQLKIATNDDNTYLFTELDNSTTPIDGFLTKLQFSTFAQDINRPTEYEVTAVFIEGIDAKE